MPKYFAPDVFTEDGWRNSIIISVTADGVIDSLQAGNVSDCDHSFSGAVIPGMVNLHSHAFQRSLIGETGLRNHADDSFWSWREAMYKRVGELTPEHIEAITAYCYMELLQGGYTAVAEFHYLHRQNNGAAYQNPAETSERIFSAAQNTGIGLTLLPVLYAWAGFGEQSLTERQLPFQHDLDSYIDLLDRVDALSSLSKLFNWGVAPHSLRAVSQTQLNDLLKYLCQQNFTGPVHIHIAEQVREIEECRSYYGVEPVRWLLDNFAVDKSWCLVHATHVDSAELKLMRQRELVVGLCPTTEADLGDGIFPAAAWQELGGSWGIGSDSNICVTQSEELRWLEYTQRLQTKQRNVLAASGNQVGGSLYQQALRGGLQATSRPAATAVAVGQRADFLVLDLEHPLLLGKQQQQWLDCWVFAGRPQMLLQVWVAGKCLVSNGQHINRDEITNAWQKAWQDME